MTSDIRAEVEAHPFWYHTIDIAEKVTTPGWFDLRSIVDRMPWPDLQGKRCLDIGTYDGFLAFEMERRGASEVIAIDVEDHLLWDWPPDYRGSDLQRDPGFSGPPKGSGFRLAKRLKGSKVEWRPLSVYDLTPEVVGKFDVVVMGSLLIHLRDPLKALESVRTVTDGHFMSSDQIELYLTLRSRRNPMLTLNGSGGMCQWYNYNAAGHSRMLYAAGFQVEEQSRPYTVRYNLHPTPPTGLRNGVRKVGLKLLTGETTEGVLHQALLARVRVRTRGIGHP